MFWSPVVSFGLCVGALAASHTDATPYIQRTLSELSVDATCPLEDLSITNRAVHQHSAACCDEHYLTSNNETVKPQILHSNPWTIYPTCSENSTTQFCVFTSQTIYSNRGLSIVTKPSIARIMARSPIFSTGSNPNLGSLSENNNREPSFNVAPVLGKGLGMIASRTIERGDLIKSHPAIGIFHNDAVEKSSPGYKQYFAPLMKLAVGQLPLASRNLFMSMAAHNESEEPLIERIYTNTFGEDFGNEEHSVVIPETARLNHDCRPNAMYHFDPKTFMHYTYAARTIYAGEEITITYIDPLQTRLKRKAAIKRSWGFECSCSLCSQEPHFVAESNRRIVQINKLTKLFDDTGRKSARVQGGVDMVEYLVGLYEQERLWGSVADAYRLAALNYAAVGRKWEALKWGMKALEAGLVEVGPKGDSVRDMRRLVADVRKHWSWGVNLGKEG